MDSSAVINGSSEPQVNGKDLKNQVNGNGHQEDHDENQYLDLIKKIIEKGEFYFLRCG